MSKFWTVAREIGFGILGVLIAWGVGYIFLKDQEFVRLGLDVSGFFVGFLIASMARFEDFRENVENELEKLRRGIETSAAERQQISAKIDHFIYGTSFLADFLNAIQQRGGLFTTILRSQLSNYKNLLSDAASGYVTITSTQPHTIVNYSQLFDHLEDGATVKATALLLPTQANKKNMTDVNRNFLTSKHGAITRIFVMPVNYSSLPEWQAYVKEQKDVGVSARFLFREDLNPGQPIDDILIADKPRIATKAEVDVASNMYKSVTLITDSDEIDKLEQTWNTLRSMSEEFNAADHITKEAERRGQIGPQARLVSAANDQVANPPTTQAVGGDLPSSAG